MTRYSCAPSPFLCPRCPKMAFQLALVAVLLATTDLASAARWQRKRDTSTPTCFAPAVKLPAPKAADLQSAVAAATTYLQQFSHTDGVDSVAAAVVTPDGSVWEGTYGLLHANESSGSVTRDSIYRLASVTKVFTTWESFLLRDRGALGLYVPLPSSQPLHLLRLLL